MDRREELEAAWLDYMTERVNDMHDWSEHDVFGEDFELTDDEFDYLVSIPLEVVIEEDE